MLDPSLAFAAAFDLDPGEYGAEGLRGPAEGGRGLYISLPSVPAVEARAVVDSEAGPPNPSRYGASSLPCEDMDESSGFLPTPWPVVLVR